MNASTGSRGRRRGDANAPGTVPSNTVGGDLERRVARLEFAEGALARLRVPVAAGGGDEARSVLTDMDILSVEVDARLRLSRSSLECKSGARQSGEATTLVWLAGFRQLMELDRVVYVRPSVSSRARALASKLDIGVLDESTLAARESSIAWIPNHFAHIDGPECDTAERRTDVQLKGLPFLTSELTQFLRYEALLADSHEILAGLQGLREAVDRQGSLPSPASHILAGHALMALLSAGMTDAGRLDHVTQYALRRRIQRALTTGDPNDSSLLEMLERADAVMRHVADRTHRAYVDAGAAPLAISVPSLRDAIAAPPDYIEDYLDFVLRLRANPLVARDLLQTVELLCFDAMVGGAAWKTQAFERLFTAEHQGLVLVATRCLRSIAGSSVASALDSLPSFFATFATASVPDRHRAPEPPVPEADQAGGRASGASGGAIDQPTLL